MAADSTCLDTKTVRSFFAAVLPKLFFDVTAIAVRFHHVIDLVND